MKLSAQILKQIEDLSKHTRNYTNQGIQTLHADVSNNFTNVHIITAYSVLTVYSEPAIITIVIALDN